MTYVRKAAQANEASQAMLICGSNNLSQLKSCLETAHNFLLSELQARDIINNLIKSIEQHWNTVCEEAELKRRGQETSMGKTVS